MTIYVIELADASSTTIDAGAMRVVDGHLVACRYQNTDEIEASWAPGKWSSFKPAAECPTCHRQIR